MRPNHPSPASAAVTAGAVCCPPSVRARNLESRIVHEYVSPFYRYPYPARVVPCCCDDAPAPQQEATVHVADHRHHVAALHRDRDGTGPAPRPDCYRRTSNAGCRPIRSSAFESRESPGSILCHGEAPDGCGRGMQSISCPA